MAREQCPRCGAQKHQLNKCPTCGFQRNQVYKEQTSNLKEAARERVGAHPKKSKKSIKPKRKTAKAGKLRLIKRVIKDKNLFGIWWTQKQKR